MQSISTFRRLSVFAGLIGILGASLSGCGGGGGSSAQPPGRGGPPNPTPGPYAGRAACAANAHRPGATARWTVLIYMQAANNLQPFSLQNVAQMASVGSDSNVNIVLQWKQIPANEVNGCDSSCAPAFVGVRRYLIHQHGAADVAAIQNGDTISLRTDRLPDPARNTSISIPNPPPPDTLLDPNGHANGTEDMGSYQSLQDFVQWGSTTYPADNLAVVIWDHGSGWLNVYRSVKKPAVTRAVAQDDEYTDEIETWEMAQGLSGTAQPIDMLVIDCSLEQMAEVAYQVRQSARIMVGSEESPPGPGYPYDKWLADLKASGTTNCDVGNSIIQEFIHDPAYVSDPQYSTILTQSMVDLSQMDRLATAVNAFGGVLSQHVNDQANLIASARTNAQHYALDAPDLYGGIVDLYDYSDRIRTGATTADLQQAALNVQNTLTGTNGVLLEAMHGPSQQNGSHGQTIYAPSPLDLATNGASYPKLAFNTAAPNWLRFLQSQVR